LQKRNNLSQDLKRSKNGRKQNTLRKYRENELATVGKTGGVLSAAFHVVWCSAVFVVVVVVVVLVVVVVVVVGV